ncbi:uncharacterized protein L199_008663 [Kwoniella botswanensis]|uniref:uncharacterized protein n=1 Tax=Kwoniella botswanensis TaxID=1268659 RepID=UPI00315DA26F
MPLHTVGRNDLDLPSHNIFNTNHHRGVWEENPREPLTKKGLTFPYSASDLLAIFHALADGHKTKEDMKNHFLTVVKHADKYPTVILPLTEEDKLQAKQQNFLFEVNYKWDETKAFPECITDWGLPFVAICQLNRFDRVITSSPNRIFAREWRDVEREDLVFAYLATRKKLGYEVFHRKYSGPRSNHIPALSGMPQWSERIPIGNLLPHPTGKRSFACSNGLCDLHGACMLLEALARQGNDTCGKGSIAHAQVLKGFTFRAYAKNDSDWNLHEYQVTIAKIGKPQNPRENDLVLYERLLHMIKNQSEGYIQWTWGRDEVPEFTDLYELAGGLEAKDEKPSVKKEKKVKAERR